MTRNPKALSATPAQLQWLRRECRRLGGDLRVVPHSSYSKLVARGSPHFYDSPACRYQMGCNWRLKRIVIDERDLAEVLWCDVIHEMAHLFASMLAPDQTLEYLLVAWEVAVIRRLPGASLESMCAHGPEYGFVGGPFEQFGRSLHKIPPTIQSDFEQAALAVAYQEGMATIRGLPISIRA